MQLTIHLNDGRQCPFTIADGPAGMEFLRMVKYWEIFDHPILRLHDGKDTWAFNTCAIERIHFHTVEDPGWAPPENIISSKSINLDSYHRKLAILDAKPQVPASQFEEGKFVETVFKITLASGAHEYFECYLMLRSHHQQMMSLYNLFQRITYPIPCEAGGFVLINPKNTVCIHIHPAPPENQDSAWLVDGFAGSASE